MAMRLRLLTLLVAPAFALGGCGLIKEPPPQDTDVSDLSAEQILNAAERRLKDVDFVSVKGKVRQDGQSMSVDMVFAPDSSSGSFSLDGMAFKVLNAGGKTYIKGNKAFYRATPDLTAAQREKVIDLTDGRWIDTGSDKGLASIASFGLRIEFFDDFAQPVGKARKGREKTVMGIVCIPVTDKEGTLYVDKRDGTPILGTGRGSVKGRLNFSYAPVAEFKRPPAADVVTVAELR